MRPSQMFRRRFVLCAAVAALPLLVGAPVLLLSLPASAQSAITVTTTVDELNTDGDCSLREAIEAANRDLGVDGCTAGSGADTISVPAGVYTIMLAGVGEDADRTGDYDITRDVRVLGAGAGSTEIAGAALDRIFHVHRGAAAAIEGLGLRGGLAAIGEDGGAVLNEGILTIDASAISASRSGKGQNCIDVPEPCEPFAGDGGGIHNSGALTMTATSVRDNQTGKGGIDEYPNMLSPLVMPDGAGGGVSNAGTLLLVQCNFGSDQAGTGAGVYNAGQAVVVETSVFGNWTTYIESMSIFGVGSSSGNGGGVANVEGALDLRKSAVYDNWTPGGLYATGGGLHAVGGSGGDGGGVYNTGVLTSTNSTVARNRTGAGGGGSWGGSGGDGGGLFNSGLLVLSNTTIVANLTGAGGSGQWGSGTNGRDGAGGGVANSGTVYSKNTLLADNRAGTSAGDAASDCAGNSLTSQGYNLFSAGECSGAATSSDLVGVAAQVAPLGDYGGPTWTCALLMVSPAIDAGSCTDSALNPIGEDQRGIARPRSTTATLAPMRRPRRIRSATHFCLSAGADLEPSWFARSIRAPVRRGGGCGRRNAAFKGRTQKASRPCAL